MELFNNWNYKSKERGAYATERTNLHKYNKSVTDEDRVKTERRRRYEHERDLKAAIKAVLSGVMTRCIESVNLLRKHWRKNDE